MTKWKKNKREWIHLIGTKIRKNSRFGKQLHLQKFSIQNGFCNAGRRRKKILVSGYKLGNH